jgi:predicted nucleic acid-binding protein
MDARLVDTNVVSYLLKGDSRGDLYAAHLDGKQLIRAPR